MRRGKTMRGLALAALAWSTGGCAVHNQAVWEPAQATRPTPATKQLGLLPPAGERVSVAVYNFVDQTGQFKTSDNVQTLSRAVTQGSTSILIKALQEAGNNSWFTVIEREKLDNLLRERAVIREMRAAYLGEKKVNPQALPPLLFAGVLLEGGIIGYDSNTKSGGSGARFLGIGGSTQYREDTVTIYLRAISVRTGEVLTNISVRKSIASVGINANAFRYVAFKDLLELEAGIAYNEPDALALQSAIETAVYGLIVEGAAMNLWCLNTTPDYAQGVLRRYYAGRDNIAADKVVLPTGAGGRPVDGSCTSTRTVAQRGGAPRFAANAVPRPVAVPLHSPSPPALPHPSGNAEPAAETGKDM
ncbi:CsgG/HfaB family protein [Sphingomonas panni]|uniref:CsgG/HfaB family protein n=1 Tax=Sphingomonas panni TaxID=237612 RepID=UPI001F5B082D|nr:CsgG/HfaB family protein [Sphingomonas panni]